MIDNCHDFFIDNCHPRLRFSKVSDDDIGLLDRLLTQIARVLAINSVNRVTAAVVDAARESLVIGMAA